MEPVGKRGLVTFTALFLLLSMSISAVPTGPPCREDEFQTETNPPRCCQRCLEGYKFVKNCPSSNERTGCTQCPEGQFMDKKNYARNCYSCKKCKAHMFEIQVSPCTRKKNTVCRCIDGYYKSFVDRVEYECLPCSTCGINEREVRKCSPEGNTECRCRDDYYKVKNTCVPCTNCTTHPECSGHCPLGTTGKGDPAETLPFLVNVIAGAAVAVVLTLVLVVVVTHFVTKRQTQKKLLSSSQVYKESQEIYEELRVHSEEPLVNSLHTAPLHAEISQESSNLPDCIPLEIKISDVIYTLLDLVPVLQVKQLVRSLGVGETVIERAELDHRSSREAHYQMLRAWAEQGAHTCRGGGGGGGQGGVLHLPQLHQLLEKLRLMHLEQTAQELETKYHLL